MQAPGPHSREAERIKALRALGLLDTGPESRFDALTRTACRMFGVPTALISLVDEDRQWFKSRVGLEACETPRDISFCGHAILGERTFVVEDATRDPRFSDNPLVSGDLHLRFYAGRPLRTAEGLPLGTLCLLDYTPRIFTEEEQEALEDLALLAETELQAEATKLAKRERLQASEARYRAMAENVPGAIYLFQVWPDGRTAFPYISSGVERIYGISAEAWQAQPSFALDSILPEDQDSYLAAYADAVARLGTFQWEGRSHTQRPGEVIWIRAQSQPSPQEDGSILWHGVLTDVTQLKLQETQLAAQGAFSQTLLENAQVGIISTDLQGLVTSFNPSTCELLGWSADDIIGKRTPALWHDPQEVAARAAELSKELGYDLQPGFDVFVAQARAGGKEQREWTFIARSGDRIPVLLSVSGIRDPAGVLVGFLGIATDLRGPKLKELALRESEARFRALVQALPDLIFVVHRDGTQLEIHAKKGHALRRPVPEMIGMNLREILPPDLVEERFARIRRVLETGQMEIYEAQVGEGEQRQDHETRVVPCGEDRVMLIVRDITERKALDRLKSEFVSTVSHELRTPLTAIRGALGLLLGGVAGFLSPQVQELLEMGQKNVERLVRLINDLLDLEKLDKGQLTFFNRETELDTLVLSALAGLHPMAKNLGVTLDASLLQGGLRAMVDPDRLAQVVVNLVSNALKYAPGGDRVDIRLFQDRNRARLEVEDHGPGIPEAFRSRIFQRFAQADGTNTREKGGTGLGLSIAKGFVERMEGNLTFESRPGLTVFRVDLPLPSSTTPASRGRVLVVEDHPATAGYLQGLLREESLTVDLATGAAEARALMARYTFDAMTLDLNLSDQDGLSFLKELRAVPATEDLPVLIISVQPDGRDTDPALAALHVVDWLSKPVPPEQVLTSLRGAMAHLHGRPQILHVEDSPDVARVVEVLLSGDAEVHAVGTLAAARAWLVGHHPDLVLLDIALPDGSGLDLVEDLRNLAPSSPPILVFSAHEPPRECATLLAEALLKSRTSNAELRASVLSLLKLHSERPMEHP